MVDDLQQLRDAIHATLRDGSEPSEIERTYGGVVDALLLPVVQAQLERSPSSSLAVLRAHVKSPDFDWVRTHPAAIALSNIDKVAQYCGRSVSGQFVIFLVIVCLSSFTFSMVRPSWHVAFHIGILIGAFQLWVWGDEGDELAAFGRFLRLVHQDSFLRMRERRISDDDLDKSADRSVQYMDDGGSLAHLTPLLPSARTVLGGRIAAGAWILFTVVWTLRTPALILWTLGGVVVGFVIAWLLGQQIVAGKALSAIHAAESIAVWLVRGPWRRVLQQEITQEAKKDFGRVLTAEFGTIDDDEGIVFRGITSYRSEVIETSALRRVRLAAEGRSVGTIAITGPRGSGKTTLLKSISKGDLGLSPSPLVVQLDAPTKFEPGDFLASLLRSCCQAHIEDNDKVDFLSPLPPSRRKRLRLLLKRTIQRVAALVGIVLAASLIGAGLYVRNTEDPSVDDAARAASALRENLIIEGRGTLDGWRAEAERALDLQPTLAAYVLLGFGALLGFISLMQLFGGSSGVRNVSEVRGIDVVVREALRYLAYELEYEDEASGKAGFGSLGEMAGRTTVRNSQRRTGFPELVAYSHKVIGQIALSRRASGCGLIVTIDELDRIGSGPEIEDFLSEIKGVFSAPGTIFILAVTDEVGSRFAARSVMGTSRIDNVMDHVVSMSGWTLSEARQLLRGAGASVPRRYVKLAYAYAGQHPRELIRVVNALAEEARIERQAALPTPSRLGFRFSKSRLLDSCDQCLESLNHVDATSGRESSEVVQERQAIVRLREQVVSWQSAELFVADVVGSRGAIAVLRAVPSVSLSGLSLLAQLAVDGATLHLFLRSEANSTPGDVEVRSLEDLAASRRHIVSRPELAESLARDVLQRQLLSPLT